MLRLLFLVLVLQHCGAFGQTATPAQRQIITTLNSLNNQPFSIPLLQDENGATYDTTRLRGKTVYVDFWFTTCVPCLAEIPYSKSLERLFSADTSVVFLKICVENIERKPDWKRLVLEKQLTGVNLFYARNRPQPVNLLRRYLVNDYPTYLLVNKDSKIIGYRVPRPSNTSTVRWVISQAANGQLASESYRQVVTNNVRWTEFEKANNVVDESHTPE